MEINLDKARAARGREAHELIFNEVAFTLPAEMSVEAGEKFAEGDIRAGLSDMLNGQAEKFYELRPSVDDVITIVNGADLPDGEHVPGLMELYAPGTPVPESSASSSPSTKASTKSRQRSSANIRST